MTNRTAFIRSLITSGGHLQLLLAIIIVSLVGLFTQNGVIVSILGVFFGVTLLVTHLPFTMWRERIKHFNNSNIDADLQKIHEDNRIMQNTLVELVKEKNEQTKTMKTLILLIQEFNENEK